MTKRVLRLGGQAQRDFAATWPQLVFWGLVALMLFARIAGPLRVIYPLAAIAVGWRLQQVRIASYVSFLVWLWFLTPLIRRIADYYAGFQEPSYVLLAPYLVTGLAAVRMIERAVRLKQPAPRMAGAVMFGLAAAGAGIGVPLGLALAPTAATLEILNYFVPLIFGWYIATRYDQLHDIERQMFVSFTRAGLVCGAYGIYQFTRLPLWDVLWMQAVEMQSIGQPEPFAVRVFGTMHSPGVVAYFLALALVFWLSRPYTSGIPGAAFAGVTLLLTSVRQSWLAFVIAAVLVVARLKPTQKLRTIVLLVIAVAGTGAFLLTPEMSERFDTRVSSMERLEEDESALSRLAGHAQALDFMTRHPLGAGIGQGDADVEALISMRDSVIVGVLVQFGLVGTLLYLASLLVLFTQLWRYYRHASSPEGMTLGAGAIGMLAGSLFGVTNAGPIGMILWMIGGLAVADRHLARQRLAAVQAAQRVSQTRAAAAQQRIAG